MEVVVGVRSEKHVEERESDEEENDEDGERLRGSL